MSKKKELRSYKLPFSQKVSKSIQLGLQERLKLQKKIEKQKQDDEYLDQKSIKIELKHQRAQKNLQSAKLERVAFSAKKEETRQRLMDRAENAKN
jgi:hypothetical protein